MARTGHFKRVISENLTEYIFSISKSESILVYVSQNRANTVHEYDESGTDTYYAIGHYLKDYEPITKQQFLSALKEAIEPINKYISETIIEQPEYGSQEINDTKNA